MPTLIRRNATSLTFHSFPQHRLRLASAPGTLADAPCVVLPNPAAAGALDELREDTLLRPDMLQDRPSHVGEAIQHLLNARNDFKAAEARLRLGPSAPPPCILRFSSPMSEAKRLRIVSLGAVRTTCLCPAQSGSHILIRLFTAGVV